MSQKITFKNVPVRIEELPRYLNEALRDVEAFFNNFSVEYEDTGNTWGFITGTLTDQTDLKNALDLKASQSSLDTHTNTTSIHFNDVPTDGKLYSRSDQTWVELPTLNLVDSLQVTGGTKLSGDLEVAGEVNVAGLITGGLFVNNFTGTVPESSAIPVGGMFFDENGTNFFLVKKTGASSFVALDLGAHSAYGYP